MKKGYNSSDISQQEGQDQARRLYRLISDNARRLDDARGCALSVSELFTPALLAQRTKLKENCERLIFLDPLLYGRKGEELLWRKVYYDVVSTAKRLRKQDYTTEEVAHLQCHIHAGLGYYHHFISKLQIEYDLKLQGIVDFPLNVSENLCQQQNDTVKAANEWAEVTVHKCLIYLGDLSRYKLELYPNWDHGLAIRYYLQALNYKPEYGMPHNQLGTLATGSNCSLDAAYHYLRCLNCTHIFEGTENNLLRLFEKNTYVIENIPVGQPEPAEHVKHLIARFLLLVDILYFEKRNPHVHNLCHQILLDLQSCLSYPKPVSSESGESGTCSELFDNDSLSLQNYLSQETVFKMIVICLMCIIKLQKVDSVQLSAVKAFILAVYSQLIQNVIEYIQGSVFNISLPNLESDKQENGKIASKRNRKCITKLRRRRMKNNTIESDQSDTDASIISDLDSDASSVKDSEISDNEMCDSTSEESDSEQKILESNLPNGSISLTENGKLSDSTNDKIKKNVIEDTVKKMRRMNPMDLLQIVADEGLLQSIKIVCDWLEGDTDILKECGNSSLILLKKIVHLINLINIEMNYRKIKNVKINLDIVKRDYNKIPLPEDVILKGVTILETAQSKIDWNYLNNYIIEPKEEALFRINKLTAFGHFLVGVKETQVIFDTKTKCFSVIEKLNESTPVEPENVNIGIIPQNNESMSRGKLMKHMGQLWLAAEVQDLESKVQGRTAFSPYLVLDVDALIHYTYLAKQLVSARKFIILVPIIVLSALDELKRETIKARDAIRWLETQFHRGNRFLRAQRPQERAPVPLIKYPKKKDKETYTFIQIIECCHFLTQQQKGASNLVTLLTGNQSALSASEEREVSCVGLAQSAGVHFELITTFHSKWKRAMKGNR